MNKPEIFTTAYDVDKETLVRYGEDLNCHIAYLLGQRIAEKIYQECQKGERIVSVGEPYSQNILDRNQIETRMDVRVQELVRCKYCEHWKREVDELGGYFFCAFGQNKSYREDFFCADGERRRSEWTGMRRE